MRCTRRQDGFVLLLAVLLVPLFGFTVLLTTLQTAQLSRSLRADERKAQVKDIVYSAEAWLRAHPEAARKVQADSPLAVPVADAAALPADCAVEKSELTADGVVVSLVITVQYPSRTWTDRLTLILAGGD